MYVYREGNGEEGFRSPCRYYALVHITCYTCNVVRREDRRWERVLCIAYCNTVSQNPLKIQTLAHALQPFIRFRTAGR